MNTFEMQGAFGYSSPEAPLTVWISFSGSLWRPNFAQQGGKRRGVHKKGKEM